MSENKGFTIIQNEIINSGKVSLKAMGLFLYLKSKPKDWRFSTLRIQKDFSDGLFAIRKAMKALEKNVREVENFLKNSMKEFEVLDFGKDGKVHWTNTKTGRMFRNLIK